MADDNPTEDLLTKTQERIDALRPFDESIAAAELKSIMADFQSLLENLPKNEDGEIEDSAWEDPQLKVALDALNTRLDKYLKFVDKRHLPPQPATFGAQLGILIYAAAVILLLFFWIGVLWNWGSSAYVITAAAKVSQAEANIERARERANDAEPQPAGAKDGPAVAPPKPSEEPSSDGVQDPPGTEPVPTPTPSPSDEPPADPAPAPLEEPAAEPAVAPADQPADGEPEASPQQDPSATPEDEPTEEEEANDTLDKELADARDKLVQEQGRAIPFSVCVFLMCVMFGALGASLRLVGSLGAFIAARKLYRNWLVYYYAMPVEGALLGVAIYLVLGAGLFTPNADVTDATQIGNPLYIYALAMLAGAFAKNAMQKLRDIANATFGKPSEQDALPQ